MEPATTDRIQQMINAEATERFPPGAVPKLVLLHYGDHPMIEPGELYLGVVLGRDGATRDAWVEEHFGRLEDFRAQRLPEVKGFSERPAYARLSERARELDDLKARF